MWPPTQGAVRQLTHDIMVMQAAANKEAARAMLERLAINTADIQVSLERLGKLNIPVDIESMRLCKWPKIVCMRL